MFSMILAMATIGQYPASPVPPWAMPQWQAYQQQAAYPIYAQPMQGYWSHMPPAGYYQPGRAYYPAIDYVGLTPAQRAVIVPPRPMFYYQP